MLHYAQMQHNMVTRIAHLYDVELQTGAVVGLVGGLSTAIATAAISLLVPFKAVRVPVAVGLTYAIGKVAHIWIEDGMPSDIERYKPMIAEFYENGKTIAGEMLAMQQQAFRSLKANAMYGLVLPMKQVLQKNN